VKTDTLTRFPGVHRRADSGIYQFGLRAPADLLSHFPKGWVARHSLGTADLREANAKAKALHATYAEQLEALRRGATPASVRVDLSQLRSVLLDRVVAALPGIDARAAALSQADREKAVASDEWLLEDGRDALRDGRVPDWAAEWVQEAVQVHTAAADAEAVSAYLLMIELRIEALNDTTRTYPLRVQRLGARRALIASSSPVTRKEVNAEAVPRDGKRMSDALAAWAENRPRGEKTLGVFTRHAKLFADMMGDPPLASIDRALAVRFRDALQQWAIKEKKTASTADNVVVSIRALVNVARDRDWIKSNPFERLRIEVGGKEGGGREPWTLEELGQLFNDPIWTTYQLPVEPKAGGAAAYWLPLLACYTGARAGELAQLWTDDFTLEAGQGMVEIRPDDTRNQRLKNANSWRAVPLHTELLRLGLADYIGSLPVGPLFPDLPTAGQNGAGGQFGKWFGDFKRAKGFTSEKKTLHSFRHLVASELRLAGATDPQADAITGHAGQGVGRTTYAATIRREADRLRPVIALLDFPSLKKLPRVAQYVKAEGAEALSRR
jgi:integrase